eukprot:gene4910-5991_t
MQIHNPRPLALGLVLVLFRAAHVQGCDMNADASYLRSLNDVVCSQVTGHNKNAVSSQAECNATCREECSCAFWLYCTEGSCDLAGDRDLTPGDTVRCYTGVLVPTMTSPATNKRGFNGFGDEKHTCDAVRALNVTDAWFYTRQASRAPTNSCAQLGPTEVGAEFVPMITGVNMSEDLLEEPGTMIQRWKRSNVHFLLGYNEPDPSPSHPHSAGAAEAARDWRYVQRVAALFDPPLTLVSPAPASADFDEDGVSPWLDSFLGNCTQVVEECDPSLITRIAFHFDVGSSMDAENTTAMVERLTQRIDRIHERYGARPLWLTELACDECQYTLSVQEVFIGAFKHSKD